MRPVILLFLIASTVTHVLGQTGPGGVGNSTSNLLWVDATAGSLDENLDPATNGVEVKRLTDFSGNDNFLNQSNSSRYGVLVTNEINGRSVVRFDGDNDRYTVDLGAGTLSNITTFIVGNFRPANQPAGINNTLFQLGNSINTSVNMIRINGSAGVNADRYYSRTEAINRIGEVLDNSDHIYSQRFESTTPFHFFNVDGDPQTVDAHNSIVTVSSSLIVGGLTGTNNNSFDGDLAEMMIFESINRTQRIIVENYLSAKYGIELDANDFFAHQATHGNDLAGIGQLTATDNHTSARGASIVTIENADDLEDNEFLIWGHDGAGVVVQSTEVPPAFAATNGVRYSQEWRVDISGGDLSLGDVEVAFDITGAAIGVNDADYRLLIDTDGDGDFSDATVDPALPNVAGSTVTFEGIALADGDFFTLGNSNDVDDCASLTTNIWPAVVWSCFPVVPDSTANVIISDGTLVRVAANTEQSANILEIEADGGGGGGTLQLDDNSTLIVKGDFTANAGGSLVIGPGATIILRGINGSQSFSNQTGDTIELENLEIDNTNGASFDDGVFTLADGLTLTNGDLTVNSSVRFMSTATQTAHIDAIPNGNTVNGAGTIEVDRFRSTRNTNWGDIASSGVITDIEDFNGEVPISGIPGGNGYAGAIGGGGFVSFFAYNNVTDQYVSPPSTSQPMTIGLGFEVFIGDDLVSWNGKAWNLQGDLHLDPITLDMNSAGGGWNLFGNPYLGFLDWDQITTDFTNIDNDEYWYVDANTGTFMNVSAGGGATIPPGQGFWVNANSNTDIDLDPSTHLASGVNDPTFLKRQAFDEQFMIHLLHEEEPYAGAAFLRNESGAFAGLDAYDISPLRMRDSGACHVSIEAGETDLMVNYISDADPNVSVPVRIDAGTPGTYNVNLNGLETFKNYQCISVTDEETGEVHYVTGDLSFPIDINNNKSSRYLTINFSNDEFVNCDPAELIANDSKSRVWANDRIINIDYQLDESAQSEIVVYNIVGERIYQLSTIADYNRKSIDLGASAAGTYIVSVDINGHIETHKVILK